LYAGRPWRQGKTKTKDARLKRVRVSAGAPNVNMPGRGRRLNQRPNSVRLPESKMGQLTRPIKRTVGASWSSEFILTASSETKLNNGDKGKREKNDQSLLGKPVWQVKKKRYPRSRKGWIRSPRKRFVQDREVKGRRGKVCWRSRGFGLGGKGFSPTSTWNCKRKAPSRPRMRCTAILIRERLSSFSFRTVRCKR